MKDSICTNYKINPFEYFDPVDDSRIFAGHDSPKKWAHRWNFLNYGFRIDVPGNLLFGNEVWHSWPNGRAA